MRKTTKLFFKYKGPLFDKSSKTINFSKEDIEKADIKQFVGKRCNFVETLLTDSEKSADGKKENLKDQPKNQLMLKVKIRKYKK